MRPAINADAEAIQKLVFSVLREYGLEPEPDGTDADLADIEAHYLRRGGLFEVLEDENGKILGTVGLYPINTEIVELRKMYFAPELRGKGWGRKVLQNAIERSQRFGFRQMYLETNSVLKEAIGLYQKFGFEPTAEKHSPRCDQAFILVIGQ